MDGFAPTSFLICRSDARFCALPLAHVTETMRPLPIERFTGMPTFVLGVSVIRGNPVPVVDAARLIGAGDRIAPARFVTLKIGERHVALAVESVVGVRAIAATSLDSVPPLLREASDETTSAIATLDAQLLQVLQTARMVPESVWAAIDAEAKPT